MLLIFSVFVARREPTCPARSPAWIRIWKTHLLEIDLLRSGQHTVAAPREALVRRGPYHYLVSLSRGDQRHECEVWGIALSSPLPRVRVPLSGSDPDVSLDLQTVFRQVYEAGAFERVLDYTQPPTIALVKADAEWADELLQNSGQTDGD
jgi:hypothetical protein